MESIKELRKVCQNKKKKEVLYFRIMRLFSIYFTKIFLMLGISANQVSFLSTLIGLSGILMFATGNYIYTIIGALILHLANVLDCCDGEIARYTKKTDLRGLYAEFSFHFTVQPLLFFMIACGIFMTMPQLHVLVLGFLASLSIVLQEVLMLTVPFIYVYFRQNSSSFLSTFKYNADKNDGKGKRTTLFGIIYIAYERFGFVYRYSTYSTLILIFAIFDKLYLLLLFYGITYPIIIIITYIYDFFNMNDKIGKIVQELR